MTNSHYQWYRLMIVRIRCPHHTRHILGHHKRTPFFFFSFFSLFLSITKVHLAFLFLSFYFFFSPQAKFDDIPSRHLHLFLFFRFRIY